MIQLSKVVSYSKEIHNEGRLNDQQGLTSDPLMRRFPGPRSQIHAKQNTTQPSTNDQA